MKRMTNQRRVILEELKKHYDHPTADEIYAEVRNKLPKVSLGTVYRNLDQMSQTGMILKLEGAGQKRFDPNPNLHPHFRCITCGKVEDIDAHVNPPVISGDTKWLKEREVKGVMVEFFGHCKDCSSKNLK